MTRFAQASVSLCLRTALLRIAQSDIAAMQEEASNETPIYPTSPPPKPFTPTNSIAQTSVSWCIQMALLQLTQSGNASVIQRAVRRHNKTRVITLLPFFLPSLPSTPLSMTFLHSSPRISDVISGILFCASRQQLQSKQHCGRSSPSHTPFRFLKRLYIWL